jgi:hypothetical protein
MNSYATAELWALRRGGESARCVATLHPRGLELLYFVNGRTLTTRVFEAWDGLLVQSRHWRTGLEARGWYGASSADALPLRWSA